jgi:hypothetical protein
MEFSRLIGVTDANVMFPSIWMADKHEYKSGFVIGLGLQGPAYLLAGPGGRWICIQNDPGSSSHGAESDCFMVLRLRHELRSLGQHQFLRFYLAAAPQNLLLNASCHVTESEKPTKMLLLTRTDPAVNCTADQLWGTLGRHYGQPLSEHRL